MLNSNLIHFNANKHRNESVYYTVANLEEAICRGKQVTFRYFYLDETGKRAYQKNGDFYTEEPMGLVFYEDNYYLICYHHYYKHPFAFRIDRMSDVDFTDQDISCEVQILTRETDFSALTEQAFKMYSGEPGIVKIRFINRLIGMNQCKTKNVEIGNITDENDLMANLAENAIPVEILQMTVKDYDAFLVERRKLMAAMIEEYYKSL